MLDVYDLVNNYDIKKIIKYGSSDNSSYDYDLLVVSNSFQDMYNHKRLMVCKYYLKSDKPLDIICLTQEEYAKLLSVPSEFGVEINNKGEVLYEK